MPTQPSPLKPWPVSAPLAPALTRMEAQPHMHVDARGVWHRRQGVQPRAQRNQRRQRLQLFLLEGRIRRQRRTPGAGGTEAGWELTGSWEGGVVGTGLISSWQCWPARGAGQETPMGAAAICAAAQTLQGLHTATKIVQHDWHCTQPWLPPSAYADNPSGGGTGAGVPLPGSHLLQQRNVVLQLGVLLLLLQQPGSQRTRRRQVSLHGCPAGIAS